MNYLTDVVAERSPLTPRSMQPSSAWSQRNRALRIHLAQHVRNNLSQLPNNEMAHDHTYRGSHQRSGRVLIGGCAISA
jgi:hypothetical protein